MLYDEIRPRLRIHKGAYKPLEDSRMLGHSVEKYAHGKMLDLGTGTGVQGIIGSLKGCDVTFADINPSSVECARENARLNGADGKFIVSDLFSKVRGKFNTIAFDPPYLRSRPLDSGKTDQNFDGGPDGRVVIDRFLAGYKRHVVKMHTILMVESYWNNFEEDIKNLDAEIVARKHYPLLGDCVVLRFQ